MKPASILVVDDEKNVRMTIAQALDKLEVEVESAVNGEEALLKLEAKDFGLILLDLRLPGMNGQEVLRRVRELRPDIPVVVITAHGTVESTVDLMKLGAVDLLQKPFSPKEIRTLVKRTLDRDRCEKDKDLGYEEHLKLARKRIGEQKLDAAREHVRLAISMDEGRPDAFNLLGALLELRGDWLDALKQYRAALALDPTYRPADENQRRIVIDHERGWKINFG